MSPKGRAERIVVDVNIIGDDWKTLSPMRVRAYVLGRIEEIYADHKFASSKRLIVQACMDELLKKACKPAVLDLAIIVAVHAGGQAIAMEFCCCAGAE